MREIVEFAPTGKAAFPVVGYEPEHYAGLVAALKTCVRLLAIIQEYHEGPMQMPWPEIEQAEDALRRCGETQ